MTHELPPGRAVFALFNEIGILNQLSSALFQARLPAGLSVAHFSVLNHLVRVGEGTTPLRLARAFQQPKTTMTHTLATLEKRGLIEMRPNPRDRRSKEVYLTDAGRAFREEGVNALAPEIEKLLADFALDDVHLILPRLTRLREILDAARDADEDAALLERVAQARAAKGEAG